MTHERAAALARLSERERIAMDLHDGVVQSLYAVLLELSMQSSERDPNQMLARLARARGQIESAIGELREYLAVLRPRDTLAGDVRAGLAVLVEQLRAHVPIRVELDVQTQADCNLDPETTQHLLYAVREATSNVIRHAAASTVSIRLTGANGQLVLSIRDDGLGFDHGHRGSHAGQGLQNIAERATRMGGRLTISAHDGSGTEVRFEVPIQAGAA